MTIFVTSNNTTRGTKETNYFFLKNLDNNKFNDLKLMTKNYAFTCLKKNTRSLKLTYQQEIPYLNSEDGFAKNIFSNLFPLNIKKILMSNEKIYNLNLNKIKKCADFFYKNNTKKDIKLKDENTNFSFFIIKDDNDKVFFELTKWPVDEEKIIFQDFKIKKLIEAIAIRQLMILHSLINSNELNEALNDFKEILKNFQNQ